jgi:radical SAM superfamily enzyme YgiQ (UPF0313 family)
MLIYLADLIHNYRSGLNAVPLNIAYVAAHAKKHLSNNADIVLFKYCDNLLDEIDKRQPSVIGLSNYTWNESLNNFVGKYIKRLYPDIPIIMGGPNIRHDLKGIKSFLETNDFVDVYITFDGEKPFTTLLEKILEKYPNKSFTAHDIRRFEISSCFSLVSGTLKGQHSSTNTRDLDYIPSPYQTGLLDDFLIQEFIPLFESNRGCPYTCAYCSWGSGDRKRVKKFSFNRVLADMNYVARLNKVFDKWILVDANFGMLSRDVKIAYNIKKVYDEYRPFHTIEIYWDKNAKKHMIKIAEILKGLSNAYIAFQTFDPYVEKMIKRKNISIARLEDLLKSFVPVSERFHTDILLGLPGETKNSHLKSLQRAYELGFDSIGGGEIRLLKGSDLETPESRKKYNIKTKFRLVQEGFGIYRNHFIAELEESVRSTKWISEKEMIKLRVLRAIFYGAVTIGELNPLLKYIKSHGVNVVKIFEKVVDLKNSNIIARESIDWLIKKARDEWFETKDDAINFFSDLNNRKLLLENPAIKLNFDFLSYLMLSPDRYDAFYELLHNVLRSHFPSLNKLIIAELIKLCKVRNYIVNCLYGVPDTCVSIALSDETIKQLIRMNYLIAVKGQISFNTVDLKINESISKAIYDSLCNSIPQVQTISLLSQKFPIYLKPTAQSSDSGDTKSDSAVLRLPTCVT